MEIESEQGLQIERNAALTNLEGLNSLTRVGEDVLILFNELLPNVGDLEGLLYHRRATPRQQHP